MSRTGIGGIIASVNRGLNPIVAVRLALLASLFVGVDSAPGQPETPSPVPPLFNQQIYEQTVYVTPASFGGIGQFSISGFVTHPELASPIQVFLISNPPWMDFSSVYANPATFKIESNGLPMPINESRSYTLRARSEASPNFGSSALLRIHFVVPEPAASLGLLIGVSLALLIRFR
jgi:hypothetical protein